MLSRLRRTRETGFTLIEILTVIIIIGVLAAIAIPVFSAQRSRAQDSQTVSDVRNIVTAAETLLSDRTKTVANLNQAALEYASSNNVLWNISGNTTTGGYCVAAYNASGKDYKSTSTLLTYDSTAGGLKKSGGSCGTITAGGNTPTPTSSTGVGSDTVRNAVAPTSAASSRNGNNGVITWTASSDSNVTGYAIQRSDTANGTFATVGTVSGRATATYTDTTAVANNTYYYRVASMVGAGTSTATSNVATLGPAFTSQTFNTVSSGPSGNVQTFVVPVTGRYSISAYGASGGYSVNYPGGRGAYAIATVNLTAGQTLNIIAGQSGMNGINNSSAGGGGGGGSFVVDTKNTASLSDDTPLVIAGGGGGGGADTHNANAAAGQAGTIGGGSNYSGYPYYNGGDGGNGGTTYPTYSGGWANSAAGGGFSGNGQQNSYYEATGGSSYINGSAGGLGLTPGGPYSSFASNPRANGGYGGGGGSGYGGGGGGGYSGGSGAHTANGGGGSSYVNSSFVSAGTSPNITSGTTAPNYGISGIVVIASA